MEPDRPDYIERRLTLQIEGWGSVLRLPTLAWCSWGRQGKGARRTPTDGVAHFRWPFHRLLRARQRAQHEVAHYLNLQNNQEMHHPWHHFCVRSAHPFRRQIHVTAEEVELADEVLRAGAVSVWVPIAKVEAWRERRQGRA